MSKKLVIAEKPSVAQMIAKVLQAGRKEQGFFEGEDYIVTWCYGHLLKIKEDKSFAKWTLEDLPIIPETWEYEPTEEEASQKQLQIIYDLINRKDVSSLVCATDAGREGELIFRLVYNTSGTKKKAERLWISSLEESTIKEGFKNLKDDKDYDNLYESALSRSHADWIVGVNATRYYTLGYSDDKAPMSVGRVQTPTLNMIVKRQEEIDNFKKEKRWAIVKNFGSWKLESEKFSDQETAEKTYESVNNKPVEIISVEREKKRNNPPLLYSLTTLQQDANRYFGLSAHDTLAQMQSLYEKRILSYPRTDSNFITSDMEHTFTNLVYRLKDKFLPSLKITWIKRLVNDDKVSDHYAVILTNQALKDLSFSGCSNDEKKILKLVISRMLSAVSPAYEYEETKVSGKTCNVVFKGSGREEIVGGWRETERILYNKPEFDTNIFPNGIKEGDTYSPSSTTLEGRDSKPPVPYTENTLLGAMDRAGAEDMPEDAERKGIGTSATRAGIIERLLAVGYIVRRKIREGSKNSYLFPTEKGKRIIEIVSPQLKDVKLTAAWEWRLKDIEKGKEKHDNFISDISAEIGDTMVIDEELLEHERERSNIILGHCPVCNAPVVEKGLFAKCSNGECGLMLFKNNNALNGHVLSLSEMKDLFHGKKVLMTLKSKTKNKEYEALISLKKEEREGSKYYSFDFEFPPKNNKSSRARNTAKDSGSDNEKQD